MDDEGLSLYPDWIVPGLPDIHVSCMFAFTAFPTHGWMDARMPADEQGHSPLAGWMDGCLYQDYREG
jgi:hypothetical protein